MQEYVDAVLGPVLENDHDRGSDLAGTLGAYFTAGSRARRSASELHVHVNTVAQRLGRMRPCSGTTGSTDRALEIQLVLRLRRLPTP